MLTVPAATPKGGEVLQEKQVPFEGRVVQVVLFFPAGCQGTTGVFITKNGEHAFPYEDGTDVALDDTTQDFEADISVSRGDKVQLRGNNSDTNSHTIRAVVTVVTEEKAFSTVARP